MEGLILIQDLEEGTHSSQSLNITLRDSHILDLYIKPTGLWHQVELHTMETEYLCRQIFFFKEVDDTEQMYFWETLSLKLSSKKNALLFPNLAELLYEFRDNLILKFRAS